MSVLNEPLVDRTAIPGADALIPEARRLRRRRWSIGLVITSLALSAIGYGLAANGGTPARSVNVPTHPAPHAAHSVVAHWTDLTSVGAGLPTGAQITTLTLYQGLYIASGDYFGGGAATSLPGCPSNECNPVVWTSTNGSQWKVAFAENAQGSVAGEQLVVTPRSLFLFNSDEGTKSWLSIRGTKWTSISIPADMAASSLISAVWGRGRLVALFDNKDAESQNRSYGNSDAIWTSINGVTWRRDSIHGVSLLETLTMSASGFFLGGESGAGRAPTIWRSQDGLTWRRTAFKPARGTLRLAAYRNDLVAEVSDSGRTNVQIWQSTDKQRWIRATINDGPIAAASPGVTSLFSTTNGFVATGNSTNKIWLSATGRAWNLIRTTPPSVGKVRLQRFFANEHRGLLALVTSSRPASSAQALTTSLWKIDLVR